MTLIAILMGTLAAGIGSVWLAAALSFGALGRYTQHMLSLAAGALMATAFMHLLPEAFESQASAHDLFVALLVGLVFFFLLDKAELWHHGPEHHHAEAADAHAHDHAHHHHDHDDHASAWGHAHAPEPEELAAVDDDPAAEQRHDRPAAHLPALPRTVIIAFLVVMAARKRSLFMLQFAERTQRLACVGGQMKNASLVGLPLFSTSDREFKF